MRVIRRNAANEDGRSVELYPDDDHAMRYSRQPTYLAANIVDPGSTFVAPRLRWNGISPSHPSDHGNVGFIRDHRTDGTEDMTATCVE